MHRKAIGPGRIFSDDGEGTGAQIGFKAGSMVKMTPDDLYRAGSGAEKLHLGVKPKSGKLIAPFQQFKMCIRDSPANGRDSAGDETEDCPRAEPRREYP